MYNGEIVSLMFRGGIKIIMGVVLEGFEAFCNNSIEIYI